ncbi:hypothetical protein WMY93_030275 [Mugilogobius chulae]|uniref:Uncharacterized protein n=1 Tax=Mugilogobius chulae TaxID=88201 RepID=A0AAW0MRP6_9GOBI
MSIEYIRTHRQTVELYRAVYREHKDTDCEVFAHISPGGITPADQSDLGEREREMERERGARDDGMGQTLGSGEVMESLIPAHVQVFCECFLCMVDVVPVKNEDGVVIMFILNFEVMTDDSLIDGRTELNHRLPTWFVTGRPRGFKLRLPLLRSPSNSKMSLNDAEVGQIPTATPLHPDPCHESLPLHPDPRRESLPLHPDPRRESLPLHPDPRRESFPLHPDPRRESFPLQGEFLPLPLAHPEQQDHSAINRSAHHGWSEESEADQRTLLSSDPPQAPPHPPHHALAQSSPCVAPHQHRLSLNPDASGSNCSLSHSRSRESFHSMRRASSVDEIEAMRSDWERKNRRTSIRPGSTGAVNSKSNILNSTSDSDLMRYRAISKIPQITLNFVDFKPDPLITLPTGEMDIIAPCKLIDRTHNVTEKVTQMAAAAQHTLSAPSAPPLPVTAAEEAPEWRTAELFKCCLKHVSAASTFSPSFQLHCPLLKLYI